MAMRFVVALACACSGTKAPAPAAPAGSGSATPAIATDVCTTAVDKLFGWIERKQGVESDKSQRDRVIAECRKDSNDARAKCLAAAADDAAIEACMTPKPRGEPIDQLDLITRSLRTYFFVHETFTDEKLALTPAKPCCQFPNKKCPPETAPAKWWSVIDLDLSTERNFQYRFESTDKKAIIEAIGDRDCDGKTITYRRELEWRSDGNMHITVFDPPADSD
jgi:hypothetical protein